MTRTGPDPAYTTSLCNRCSPRQSRPKGPNWFHPWVELMVDHFTAEASRKSLGGNAGAETDEQDNLRPIPTAVEPRRLAPVEIEPLSHYDHFSGELGGVLTLTQPLAGCVALRGAG